MRHFLLASIMRKAHLSFGLLMSLFMIGPLLAVVPISFSSGSFLSYPLPGFSLQWYERVFTSGPWMSALSNSLVVGATSTALATVLGTLAALAFARRNLPVPGGLLGLLISPMIFPPVISGLGMYFLFGQLGLTGTMTGLILAHTVLATPFVLISVAASLQGFDMTLLKAAAMAGASPARAFVGIAVPIIAPGIVSGALFAFMTSFDEIVVTLFIGGPSQRTLPRQMFDGIRDTIDPSILAMSTFLLVVGIAGLLSTTFLTLRAQRNNQRKS
ncbi:Trehalose transport system permease protein SugB [Pseudomonas sp. THAF187a]|uniref:Putative spermidine/putrescine transport system permease protein n=1 Tax=Ectopseudomonas oleovorans TaxID=301 RepID=A0A653B7P0_ECTOL|nr:MULTISPECIES: ABC transporter permease [Pseudomonas]QFT21097.1 Trehalose transport system permease protein SugB [Pseudomonas sp. THAF187a]QFT41286.1 Trehalose transport system permease protein SugB [Pseudomonas sp. THAF42]QTS87706.1 ABC transporter permease [Pseudomonas khazarica]CAE6901754.1 Spermidine Putrescine ABC transporter permease component potC (TC_3.A.1.11.1) [Pseudomonas oleovorans]